MILGAIAATTLPDFFVPERDVEGVMEAAGIGATTFGGRAILVGALASSGAGAASFIGADIFSGALAAAGTGASSLVGDTVPDGTGDLSAAGVGATSIIGAAIGIGIESSSGIGASSIVGSAISAGVMSADGVGASSIVGSTPVVYATFDGTATDVTVTGSGLIATHSNTNDNAGVRSTAAKNSGKWYFEVTAGSGRGNGDSIGLITAAGTYNNVVQGPTNCAVTRYFLNPNGGEIYSNNADSGKKIGTFASSLVCIATDLDNDKIWFRLGTSGNWNGDGTADPATNTGGVSISSYSGTTLSPVVCFGGSGSNTGHNFTANFGSSAFSGTVPSGFTSGWTV